MQFIQNNEPHINVGDLVIDRANTVIIKPWFQYPYYTIFRKDDDIILVFGSEDDCLKQNNNAIIKKCDYDSYGRVKVKCPNSIFEEIAEIVEDRILCDFTVIDTITHINRTGYVVGKFDAKGINMSKRHSKGFFL